MGDDDDMDCALSSNRIPRRRLIVEPGFRLSVDEFVDVDEEIEINEEEEEEEEEGEYEDDEQESNLGMELGCPYCPEDFDALGLCVHLQDQHPIHIKSGICPLCVKNLGKDMVSHLIIQHEGTLRALRKTKLRTDESSSILSLLRKKLQDEILRSLPKESSSVVSSSNMTPDPLLLSFMYGPPKMHEPEVMKPKSSTEPALSKKTSDERTLESAIEHHPSKHKDEDEKARRCDFVHSLLFSTIFADGS